MEQELDMTENTTPNTEIRFTDGENPFDSTPICLRISSFPTSLLCFLVVELNGAKHSINKFRTELLDLEWLKSIDESFPIANEFARTKCDDVNGKASYLISASYSIHQQRSPNQAVGLTRADDEKERRKFREKFDLAADAAQSWGYKYVVHSTNTLTRLENWYVAWNEQFPFSIAKALVEVEHAVYIVEMNFRYQVYSQHEELSCEGGRQCFNRVIQALTEQSVATYRSKVLFIPTRFFSIYFTKSVVDHLLSRCNDGETEWDLPILVTEERARFVRYVWEFGTRLLATCIYARLGIRRLYELYQAKIGDHDLPLVTRSLPLAPSMVPDWPENVQEIFCSMQLRFCAYQFQSKHDDEKLLHIKDGVIMPFLEKGCIESSQGSSAEVSYVKIHEQHHEFSNDRSQLFAVKSFKKNDEDFEKEKEICRELALHPHDHLTPYLTAWEDTETFNILFPKAESDLHTYLMHAESPDTRSPKKMSQRLPWFLDQMLDLSEGLASIHRLGASHVKGDQTNPDGQAAAAEGRQRIVCHHDLKPSNILVFRDRQGLEIMKISDFGLAKVKERTSRDVRDPASPRTRANLGTWEYMSPEKTLLRDSSRPSDVWSLGCIFLVMLLWFFGDPQNLEEFRAARAKQPTQEEEARVVKQFPWYEFWHLPSSGARRGDSKIPDLSQVVLKHAVEAKFNWLKSKAKLSNLSNGVLIDLVDLVSLDMLKVDPVARKCAPYVCSELKNFSQRAERTINRHSNRVDEIPSTGVSPVTTAIDTDRANANDQAA